MNKKYLSALVCGFGAAVLTTIHAAHSGHKTDLTSGSEGVLKHGCTTGAFRIVL